MQRLSAFGVLRNSWLCLLALAPLVASHGQMIHPVSRNVQAYLDGVDWCPQCLNAGGSSVVSDGKTLKWPAGKFNYCGDRFGETKWDVAGPNVQTYTEGQAINIDFMITENHLGRIDTTLCDLDAKPGDNKCMQLERVDGKGEFWYLPFLSDWSGGNPGYEKPAYSDGSFGWYDMPEMRAEEGCTGQTTCNQFKGVTVYRTQWQLPRQVNCRRCKLQWHYMTFHNCWAPCSQANRDEPTCQNVQAYGECGTAGAQYPESFWNCADVQVISAAAARARGRADAGSDQAAQLLRDVPAWESKVTVHTEPYGTPRAYKMGGGGWSVRTITLNKLPETTAAAAAATGRRLLRWLGM